MAAKPKRNMGHVKSVYTAEEFKKLPRDDQIIYTRMVNAINALDDEEFDKWRGKSGNDNSGNLKKV